MLRSAASKVAWVGRTASMVFGLVMALVLGRFNAATALTKLTGNVNGAAMQVVNSNAGADDTALSLSVQAGEAPMRVNSNTRVANLNAATAGRADSAANADNATNAQNANTLDNKDSAEFAQRLDSGTYTIDFESIPAQSCTYVLVDPSGVDSIPDNAVVTATPGYAVAGKSHLSFYAGRSNNSLYFRLVVCNVSTIAIDPGSDSYHWMIFQP